MAKATKKPETQLLAEVTAAIEQVDEGRRERFIAAVATYFGLSGPVPAPPGPPSHRAPASGPQTAGGVAQSEFSGFEDLYDACHPSRESDKALVGGFWFQAVQSHPTFTAQEVNAVLKDVGHGIGNITDAFTALQDVAPALARQVAKSGKARQARKTYKLTTAGVNRVKQLMSGSQGGDE